MTIEELKKLNLENPEYYLKFEKFIYPPKGNKLMEKEKEETKKDKKPECSRCNDNGCPACDGTRGSKYNPEPF